MRRAREITVTTVPADSQETRSALIAECDAFIAEHKQKADKNEVRARVGTIMLIGSTASIPVAIIASSAGHPFLWGKLLPSILAALSAVVAGLLTAERPHERWSLYRRYQRLFESERLRYTHGEGCYSAPDADARFTAWLADGRVAVHEDWAGLMPRSGDVVSVSRPS